jgi:septal ring factor EnvC (AmiA/AmiB activator)
MRDLSLTSQLDGSVIYSSDEVVVSIRDRRAESLSHFGDLGEAQREQLATDAWSIGLRALHNAQSAAQESKLRDVGEALLSDIDRQLRAQVERQQVTIAGILERFFDPKDGQVTQRLEAFVADQGVLARLLDKYLGPQNSVLAEALARQVGESSPLFRKLSPTESDGVLKSLEGQLRVVMDQGHAELVRALDPLAEDGAVARFLRSVREELKGADARQTQFEKEVREALARIETRRSEDQKSFRGGLDFEEAVVSFVRTATRGAPCTFDITSTTAGLGSCKKGDAVLRFTSESAFAGIGVVFEVKHAAGYTVQRALDELDAARRNRDAGSGVFVMARSHASDVFPRFARFGSNVVVTWDDQDAATDAYLHAAILLGMGLVMRVRASADAGDLVALRDVEARIEAELSRLEKMEKHSEAIRRNVDGISSEIRRAQRALDHLLQDAQSTLRALKVELHDEAAERASPIQLPNQSFQGPKPV